MLGLFSSYDTISCVTRYLRAGLVFASQVIRFSLPGKRKQAVRSLFPRPENQRFSVPSCALDLQSLACKSSPTGPGLSVRGTFRSLDSVMVAVAVRSNSPQLRWRELDRSSAPLPASTASFPFPSVPSFLSLSFFNDAEGGKAEQAAQAEQAGVFRVTLLYCAIICEIQNFTGSGSSENHSLK